MVSCRIYDGSTYNLIGKIDLGEDADNVRYDAARLDRSTSVTAPGRWP